MTKAQAIGGPSQVISSAIVVRDAQTLTPEEFARLIAEGQELRREFDRQTGNRRPA